MAASSALAVSLLGLAAEPAQAKATLFALRTGAANPMDGLDVGSYSRPAFVDLDGDGDLDVVSHEIGGTILYYKNTGTATSPAYTQVTGSANPFNGFNVGGFSSATFGDLDGDGDQDLLMGAALGFFVYFKNTGSVTTPAFVQQFGSPNPFNGQDVGSISVPAFGDLDGDGDLDVVVGEGDGGFFYFQNTGTATSPAFVQRTGAANPLNGQDAGFSSAPVLGDLDGDGDLDLVSGEHYGAFVYYQNTGSATRPAFVLRSGAANPLAGQDAGARSLPALGDVDGDGDLDLLAGNSAGTFAYYENLAGSLVARTGAENPLNGQDVGAFGFPGLVDLDQDGDLDLMSGEGGGHFVYYVNTGSASSPAFASGVPLAGPTFDVGDLSRPTFGDLDHDGDLDMLSGAFDGTFYYYENTGTATTPLYVLRTGAANPLNGVDVINESLPSLGDLDGDGDLDLVTEGAGSPNYFYFENTGTAASPAFVQRTGSANPFDGMPSIYTIPTLADVDGDGDLDLVAGTRTGAFIYLENTGNVGNPVFVERTGAANPLSGQDVGSYSAPALGDLDGDGDLDVVAGEQSGTFFYIENAIKQRTPRYFGPVPLPFGSADIGYFSSPAAGDLNADGIPDFVVGETFGSGVFRYFEGAGPYVVERTGSANPFNGVNSGAFPLPALGDLDGDGDLDLVAGDNYGAPLRYYENTGSATQGAFVQRTGSANPLNGAVVGRPGPALGDVDGDGDLDLVVGEFLGNFHYFENTGNAKTPLFVERTGTANPFNGLAVGAGSFATAALGDVDGDGDLDLMAGDEGLGRFHYFENTGTRTAPAFVERTGAANPLDGKSVGLNSTPTFVDVDRDGDLDVVSGERYGQFRTYYLPEPGMGTLLGAGLGLLALLDRWRKRRDR